MFSDGETHTDGASISGSDERPSRRRHAILHHQLLAIALVIAA
jgi:hypothetical protein